MVLKFDECVEQNIEWIMFSFQISLFKPYEIIAALVTPQNVTIDAKCNINAKCNNFWREM